MTTADEDLMALRSRDIGLDSLISVDIRSWFLKNFEVSVPVLKIMGNDTMAELADLVAEQAPASLLPGLAGDEAPAEAPAASSAQTLPTVVVHSDEAGSSSADSDNDATPAQSRGGSTGYTTPTSIEAPVLKGPVKIDWSREVTLPKAASIPTDIIPAARPQTIVLTGVSGLLGRSLLLTLLDDPSIVKIICIAVRRLDERLQSEELPANDRIEYYPGDLEQPRLGLSASDAANIFSRADAVIHNGADTSHLKFYPEIKAANTGSTSELISFCMTRKIPIHYLSTVGVALFGNYESFPQVSAAAHHPATDGSHGYVSAKWVSERLLEELHKQHSVNVWIHRPSTIIREGADAVNTAAQTDWMNALMAYMRKTQAVPVLKNLRGALDFVSVRNATNSILTAVLQNKAEGPTYIHQVGDIVLPLDNLKEFVARDTGASKVEELPVEKWSARAVSVGLNRGVAALIDSMDDPGQPHYPRMLRE